MLSDVKRHRRLLIALLACGGLVAIAVVIWPKSDPEEPTYQGEPLSQWIRGAVQGGVEVQLPKANVEAVRQIGTNGLPSLIKWVKYQPPQWYSKVPLFLWRVGWIRGLRDRPVQRANDAIVAFRILGQDAGQAAPALVSLLDNTNRMVQATTLLCLSAIGHDAVPAVLDLVTNRPAHRHFAPLLLFPTLEQLGTNACSAAPVLMERLNDPDPEVAVACAYLLGALGMDGREPKVGVIQALSTSMQSTNAELRRNALSGLTCYGPRSKPAMPALLKALSDPDSDVRWAATNALLNIAPETLTNVGVLSH